MYKNSEFKVANLPSVLTTLVSILLVTIFSLSFTQSTVASEPSSDRIARMAMSTSSLWMMGHHEHEIVESLTNMDTEKALEEAEELLPWIKGTLWVKELEHHAMKASESVQKVVDELKTNDIEGAKTAIKEMKMTFHHLHHELMEIVSGGESMGGHKM